MCIDAMYLSRDALLYPLEAIDFGRRMAIEKETKTEGAPQRKAYFYDSLNFVWYPLIFLTVNYV